MEKQEISYLIIGNSAGGTNAAEAIRELDRAGRLTIISDEPYPAYCRPLIAECLARPLPLERMLYRKPEFYRRNGIEVILGERVVAVDRRSRTVSLAGGRSLAWGKLLLATGGAPVVPGTSGIELKGVFPFNRLDDAKMISAYLEGCRGRARAVVIGGGLIGTSVAEALVRRGVRVTMVEMRERILGSVLDDEAAAMMARVMEEGGVNIICGQTVESIAARPCGAVGSVSLSGGKELSCDLVILAIGVRPRLELAQGAGIRVNHGIVVDRYMRTSAPDIYACGDVAEAFDFVHGKERVSPVLPNAAEGGRIAGKNMAGLVTEYRGGTSMNALKYFGLTIVAAGLISPPDGSYEVFSYRRGSVYRKVVVRDGKVAGLIFAGEIEKSGIVYNLMKEGTDVSRFKGAFAAEDFGLASLPRSVWQKHLRLPQPGMAEAGVVGLPVSN